MLGPVLRGAVEALLKKRKIEYYPMKGKGGFLVNAASGFVLYEPSQPRDSKVIVAPNSASVSRRGQHPIRHSTFERELSENREGGKKALKKSFHNRCKEKAAFDEAISKSLGEEDRVKAENEQLLKQAFNLSLLEKQKETEEEQKLCEAMEISKRESIINAMDEDEQIRKTLTISKTEFDLQSDPDGCLLRAFELSRKQSNEVDNEMLTMFEDCALRHEQDKDDEGLLKALELSVVEF